MSLTKAIEDAIVAQLKTTLDSLGFTTEPLPENPAAYSLTNPRGAVLVNYLRSTNGPAKTEMPLSYERAMTYSATLLVRGFRTPQGAHDALESARTALDGWTPPGCVSGYVLGDEFKGHEEGVFQLQLLYEATARVIRPISAWS